MTSWIQHSKVVPAPKPRRSSTENVILVESSSDRRDNFPHVYDFDAIGIANECSEIFQSYSTEKPLNFSLEASPVKKENSSLNILDSSFDVGFKSSSTIVKSAAKSNNPPFDKLFETLDNSAVLGISRLASGKNRTDAFSSSRSNSVVNPHHSITTHATCDDVSKASLIREIEVLNNRLALLEQVVHRMEYNITNPVHISDSSSTSSHELHLDRPQDIAFTIDYCYGSSVREEITYNDDLRPVADEHDNHAKGAKFSFRRAYRSWLRGRKLMRKTSCVEV